MLFLSTDDCSTAIGIDKEAKMVPGLRKMIFENATQIDLFDQGAARWASQQGYTEKAVRYYADIYERIRRDEFRVPFELLDKAIELEPKFHEAFCARAFCHFKEGKLDRAEDDLSNAQRLNGDYLPTKNLLRILSISKRSTK